MKEATDADMPEILRRYAAGESFEGISKVDDRFRELLYTWLLGGRGDEEHAPLIYQCLVVRVTEAERAVEAGCRRKGPSPDRSRRSDR
jgi:hypothetical protein